MATLNAYNAIQRASSAEAASAGTAAARAARRQFPVARLDFRPSGERDAVRRLAD